MLGFINDRAIDAVVAVGTAGQKCTVVTVYPPDAELWNNEFRTRRT
jgi:hypothetical protein